MRIGLVSMAAVLWVWTVTGAAQAPELRESSEPAGVAGTSGEAAPGDTDYARAYFRRGRHVIGGGFTFTFRSQAASGFFASERERLVTFNPSWTYFVHDRVGLGVDTSFSLAPSGDYSLRVLGVGLSAQFGFPLSERLSFLLWPRVGYQHTRYEVVRDDGQWLSSTAQGRNFPVFIPPSFNASRLSIGVYAPLQFHPNAHVALGFGPMLRETLTLSSNPEGWMNDAPLFEMLWMTHIGVSLGGSDASASAARAAAPSAASTVNDAQAYYGRGRQVVGGGFSLVYRSQDASGFLPSEPSLSLIVRPSWTYFLRDRIGFGVHGTASFEPSLGQSSTRRLGAGVHAIFGFPFGERLSFLLWPSVSYQNVRVVADYTGADPWRAGVGIETSYLSRLTAGLYAPVQFHPNAHVAVGFGPMLRGTFQLSSSPPGWANDAPIYEMLWFTQIGVSLGGRDSVRPPS